MTPRGVTSVAGTGRTRGMDLLTVVPELPLLLAIGLLAVLAAAVRRTLARIGLVVVLLLAASIVLHWPPPALGALCVTPGTLPG